MEKNLEKSNSWIVRVQKEATELSSKIQKLMIFMCSKNFDTISMENRYY